MKNFDKLHLIGMVGLILTVLTYAYIYGAARDVFYGIWYICLAGAVVLTLKYVGTKVKSFVNA